MCSLVLSIFSFPWNENAFSHHLMKSTWKKNDSCLFFLLHAVMKLVATKITLARVTWKPLIYFFHWQRQAEKILKVQTDEIFYSINYFILCFLGLIDEDIWLFGWRICSCTVLWMMRSTLKTQVSHFENFIVSFMWCCSLCRIFKFYSLTGQ